MAGRFRPGLTTPKASRGALTTTLKSLPSPSPDKGQARAAALR